MSKHESERKEIHDRVLNAANVDALADAYAEWAPRYDADLVQEMGYRAYVTASELLAAHETDLEARILDAGCGTGLVGAYLADPATGGYTRIDGLDYSPDMLAQARSKGVYADLLQGDLTGTLGIPSDRYDAVISVGTFHPRSCRACRSGGAGADNETGRSHLLHGSQ